MNIALKYVGDMLPYMLGSVPIVALVLLLKIKLQKKQPNWRRELALGLFLVFLAGLLSQAVLPRNGELDLGEPYFTIRYGLNLVPLRVVGETAAAARAGNWGPLVLNVVGNVVMFMPIGFFAGLLWRRGLPGAMGLAAAVSVFIELNQLFQFRATDIDDVVLNVLGGALGYLVFLLLRKIAPRLVAGR